MVERGEKQIKECIISFLQTPLHITQQRLHDGTSDIPPCSQYGGRFELASNLPLQSISKIKPIWSVYEMAGSLNENRPK